MKKLIYILFLMAIISCQSGNKNPEQESAQAPVKVVETKLNIGGMHCDMCVASIEKGVNELQGIEYVKASLDDSTTIVKYDVSKVNLKQIESAINRRGYTVKSSS